MLLLYSPVRWFCAAALVFGALGETGFAGPGFDVQLMLEMSDFSKIAYCLHSTGSSVTWDCIECAKYPGVTVSQIGRFNPIFGSGCKGYVANDPQRHRVVVSFAGSSDVLQWLNVDGSCEVTHPDGAGSVGRVHGGMYGAYLAQRDTVLDAVSELMKQNSSAELIITGHSLGATQAYFAAMDLTSAGLRPAAIYVFAPARAGDHDWATAYERLVGAERTFYVTHFMDPVPHSPFSASHPCLNYVNWRHVGTEVHYELGVDPENYTMCPPGVEDPTSKCGTAQYTLDPVDPNERELWNYHLCYPGQCGVPALGLPCSAGPPLCNSPYTSMANCLTGDVPPAASLEPEEVLV